ncbi:hypothetical protein UG55_102913 [Frankia sp. EI5c]|uniref:hypothetical protein n=1 Tax=Frankia sp. EI5c TaxID=683316 RepID=UPI0007C38FB7|nr:hypothetical protein [Frankia sp. EI5c]OAA24492.1 hypothetical protein UG55_102913 [Frankia sp. EI5c]
MSTRSDIAHADTSRTPTRTDADPADFEWWVHEIDPFRRLSPTERQARARAARRHWIADIEAATTRCRRASLR